jgi:putative endonuclease
MHADGRRPAGPRGAVGAAAEDAAAEHLRSLGWRVLARNVRVGPDELDILALQPGDPVVLVIVEVRSRSGPGFGAAVESIDARKVARLYRAASGVWRERQRRLAPVRPLTWRVDLLTLGRAGGSGWRVEAHVRGLAPP